MILFSLPINLIRQYLFCPRIPYFLEVLDYQVERPIWVNMGTDFHQEQIRLTMRRTLKRFELIEAEIFYNVELQDENHNFHGVCDAILESENNVYPIEFKSFVDKPTKSQIMQLMAYGILAENKFAKKFDKGFILSGKKGKCFAIDFDEKQKLELKTLVNKIIKSFDGLLPSSSATAHQCGQCEFLNFCNDRE